MNSIHPRHLLQALRADLRSDTERGRLVRSAGITAGLKIGATLIAFGASLVYARALKPHGYGLYAYVLAWAALLTIPVGLGLSSYLVREGAKAPDSLRWLLRWADKRLLVSGFLCAALLACAVFLPQAADARWLFVIAAPLPLLNNLNTVLRSLLQARGRIVYAQWPLLIFGPGLMLLVLAGLWFWRGSLAPVELVSAMTGSALIPLSINYIQLRRVTTLASATKAVPVRVREALPFMWLGMLYLLNNRTDLVMLGTLKGAHDAGIYAVASRAGELVTFFMMAAGMVLAPRIANFYHEGEYPRLQRLLTGAMRRILLISSPLAVLFLIAAHPLLRYLYGPAYAEGAVALQILAGAQLLSLPGALKGTVLNMTGHERISALGVGASAALNIALNAILIPFYGVEGAAIATGSSLVVLNVMLGYWMRRRLHLVVNSLGPRWFSK